jgi:hypothetical protein
MNTLLSKSAINRATRGLLEQNGLPTGTSLENQVTWISQAQQMLTLIWATGSALAPVTPR